MNQVERARRFVVVLIPLELPAFHHRAAVRKLHAIEIIFDHNAALVRGGLWRARLRRRCAGPPREWSRGFSRLRRRRKTCGPARRLRGGRARRILSGRRKLWPKKLAPPHDGNNRQHRGEEHPPLRRQLFVLRIAHARVSFSAGTGSKPPRANGWQRRRRFSASHAPCVTPWTSIASYAYRAG